MSPATYDAFVRSFARLRCEKSMACEPAAWPMTPDECVAQIEALHVWDEARERLDYGVLRYDEDGAAACLRLLRETAPCAAHAASRCSGAALVGTIAEGQECDALSANTCAPGTRCHIPEESNCGSCQPFEGGRVGDSCQSPLDCLRGQDEVLDCLPDPAAGGRTCRPIPPPTLVGVGESCGTFGPACEVGSNCRGTPTRCVARPASGEECDLTGFCDDGARCVGDATSSSGFRCRPLRIAGDVGASCGNVGDDFVQCLSSIVNLRCDDATGTCILATPGDLGDACGLDRPCGDGLRCYLSSTSGFRECAPAVPDGAPCVTPDECAAGYCSPNQLCGHPSKVNGCGG